MTKIQEALVVLEERVTKLEHEHGITVVRQGQIQHKLDVVWDAYGNGLLLSTREILAIRYTLSGANGLGGPDSSLARGTGTYPP